MNDSKRRVTMIMLGIFAYLILSILFWQKAVAAEDVSLQLLGPWYEWMDEGGDARNIATYVYMASLNAALVARSVEECRESRRKVEYKCVILRTNSLRRYFAMNLIDNGYDPINLNAALQFLSWCRSFQADKGNDLALMITSWAETVIRKYEPIS